MAANIKNVYQIKQKVVIDLYTSKKGVKWEIEKMASESFECMWAYKKVCDALEEV